jgi:PAS domain S-box-containing protein
MNLHKRIFLSKPQLLKLIDRLPGAVYQYRQWKNGRCTFPYSALDIEEIFFASPVALSKDGQIAWNVVCPESIELVQNTLKKSAETLEEFEITFSVRSPQGQVHWIRNHATPERLRDGSILWHGHMENVTAQHDAEEVIKRKTALLNVIFENLPDHIYYMDRESRILGTNPACCRHHGKTAEEMIGKTDLDFYPDELGKRLFDEEQQMMAEGKVIREQEKHVGKDGSIIYLESVKTPLRSPSGRVIGLAGISRDITQQVENERALSVSEGNLRLLLNSLPQMVLELDVTFRCQFANKTFCDFMDKSLDKITNRSIKEVVPNEWMSVLHPYFQEAEQGLRTRTTTVLHSLDGYAMHVEIHLIPEILLTGSINGYFLIFHDVSSFKQKEKELVESQQEAEAANKAKSAFLAMMSHEIRTPMNGVIGAASLLLGTELSALQEEFVHTIETSGENLLTIINDILDYSKIESGKIELEKTAFNLRECIEDAFDLFMQPAAKKNVELLYYVEPEVPKTFLGDTTRLRQIIVNLLGNAIKFTENGEVTLKVNCQPIDEIKRRYLLEFAVHDTGIGIADEHKDRLFQAFTQADASSTRKYGGTGLGLTISRKLTELMGGKIWFESEAGKGSTFFFTVELQMTDCVEGQKIDHLPIEALRGKHALIVDDNKTNRWLLSELLAQWGMRSEAFEHPEKALENLQKGHRYDIALIDFQMPGIDGNKLAKEIYRIAKEPRIPVIILSSSYEHIPDDPAISARLSKPVKVGKLCSQILKVLAETKIVSGEKEAAGTHIQPKKLRHLRVLVAEDNPINQRIAQMMLQRIGCETVVIVSDGEEAVAAAMDAPFDVILMDIQMPRMNGIDASRKIRELTGHPTKPWIIALSAGVMKEEQITALEAGMNEFVAKPLVVAQLEKTLDNILPA